MNNKKICVVGSCNYDLIAYTDRLPKQGETIMGNDFKMGFGGKGANQAVAAAKLGAEVIMVGKLGNDIFGKQTLENFKSLNITTEFVFMTDKAPSGVAPIWVSKEGSNSIIVVAGANNLLTEDNVEAARKEISKSKIMICQNEIPLNVTMKALSVAKEENVLTIFNPAPAPKETLTYSFFKLIDIFCPNESEAELLTGVVIEDVESAVSAGRVLIKKGVKKVLMTLGERGALIIQDTGFKHVKSEKVNAIDTTGAGDCFIGSFAHFLTQGCDEETAAKRACFVASLSVQKHGTQTSYPTHDDMPADIF